MNTLRLHYKQGQFNDENLGEKQTNVRTSEKIFSIYARIVRHKIKFDLQTQTTNYIPIRQAVSDIKEAHAIPAVVHSFLYKERNKKRQLLCAKRGSVTTKYTTVKS